MDFSPFSKKMQAEGLPEVAQRTFRYYYEQLVDGQTGLIAEKEIQPVESLDNLDTFPNSLNDVGRLALARCVVIKLNGGLGTSMGLAQPKSLLPIKNDLTFLDIIARQALQQRTPLVFMNSFSTHDETMTALEKYPDLSGDLPPAFLQHKVPKVAQADLTPIDWPADPELEWCPPGHGDIYTALVTSGMLAKFLAAGYEYAFISNVDNLGAVINSRLLGYFVINDFPFMMEVADRTSADRKGGHLAQRPNGQLILRESAQCPDDDIDAFQDVNRHRFFNTNNLWLNLPALQTALAAQDYILGLPMIRNRKTVDPRDPDSPGVYQLETAMGSAIATFPGAGAVRVPRNRFAPVKKTNDLLNVRSDNYQLTDNFHIVPDPGHPTEMTRIDLDEAHYRLVDDLDRYFPAGPPSLRYCDAFTVRGPVRFGENVVLKGEVYIVNESAEPADIPDEATLTGTIML